MNEALTRPAALSDGAAQVQGKSPRIAVVIPCYRVRGHVMQVLQAMAHEVTAIFCVDDACPERSGHLIEEQCRDPRVRVLFRGTNGGVGAAMITGYRAALEHGCDVIVKIDGDGQMDPSLIPLFVAPIADGHADYCKGNRFYFLDGVRKMPRVRIFGNAVLSFMTKLSSGYWTIFDPTNGYTAIRAELASVLPLDEIAEDYFFESDMLFQLYNLRAVVLDVPMRSRYGSEQSSLSIRRVVLPFLLGHGRNFVRRVVYNYFVRDFNLASLELVLGLLLGMFGFCYGIYHWIHGALTGTLATSGTVMVAALPMLFGMQLLLAFLNYDIRNVPQLRPPLARMPPRPIPQARDLASVGRDK